MKKKYQVFISSTYRDLIEERSAVTQTLLDCDCIPVGMEQFPASEMSQMDYIRKMLDDCDYYILIMAGMYGSEDSDGISFTEKEYDYAKSKGIPVMSFVVKDPGKLLSEKCESTEEKRSKLLAFRQKVCNNSLVKMYSNISELQTHVAISLHKCIQDYPAIGWIRANSVGTDEIEQQIESYLAEHTITNEEIQAMFNETFKVSDHTLILDCGNASSCPQDATTPAAKEVHGTYLQDAYRGIFTFDYSNNNGEFIIGREEFRFVTRWSKASNTAIHAYRDSAGIVGIARIKGPVELKDALKHDCNFSSRTRTPEVGDVIVWKNTAGNYAATKILNIKDDSRGSDHDELTCEYMIYT